MTTINSCESTKSAKVPPELTRDNWVRDEMRCATCMYYRVKHNDVGRCRRRAPTHEGYPVVFCVDPGCGDHKLS